MRNTQEETSIVSYMEKYIRNLILINLRGENKNVPCVWFQLAKNQQDDAWQVNCSLKSLLNMIANYMVFGIPFSTSDLAVAANFMVFPS